MAGGFLKGLVHGGLLGVVALAGLSLLVPLPGAQDRDGGAEPEVSAAVSVPAAADPTPAAPAPGPEPVAAKPAAPEPAAPEPAAREASPPAQAPAPAVDLSGGAAPDTGAVGLPVGSEFGRGGDIAPRLPAPQSASPRTLDDPVAVPAPASEPAPVALTADMIRPETLADDRMPAQALPQDGGTAPGLTVPQTAPEFGAGLQAPRAASVPDQGPGQDAAPLILPAHDDATPGDDATPTDTPEAEANVPPADGAPVPGLPSPSLDLSLPPDLTDLRRLERN
ncbi:hypothetical protein [Paracoccus nototheniae]|uniref:Uncharacterized protein n=1 Tax=Paracoccus nototheniae TaxID=2489002 RepID=A0ABW4DY52_9RHOB